MIHIVALLGLSFYISKPVFESSPPPIKVRLNSDAQQALPEIGDSQLESFNFAMDTGIEPSAVTQTDASQDEINVNIKIVSAVNRQLQSVANELEKLRQQQTKLLKQIDAGSKAIEVAPREIFTASYSADGKFDEYKENWRKHVEIYGNRNYPQQISAQSLSGKLILDAIIKPSGSLLRVDILRSSGHPAIDQAAIEIVQSSAPYPPLPADTQANVLVHIIRTWEFKHSHVISAAY